jgi:hypothetical protein
VAQLGPTPGETDKSLTYLGPLFDAAESRAVAARSGRGGYEPREIGPAVAKTPLAFTRVHRVGRVAGVEMYLFEAVRTYAPVPARPYDCDDLTVMTGWLAEGRLGAFSLLDSETARPTSVRASPPAPRLVSRNRTSSRLPGKSRASSRAMTTASATCSSRTSISQSANRASTDVKKFASA